MNEAVSKRQTGNWRFEAASSESGQREGGNPRAARSTGRAGQGYGAASQHGFKYFSKNQREGSAKPGRFKAGGDHGDALFFTQGDPAQFSAPCRGSSPVPVRHRTSGLVPSLIQREILLETSGARQAKPGSVPSHGAIHERRLRSRGLSWYNSPKGGGDSRRKRRGWAAPGARRETRSPPARRLIIRKGAGDSRPPGQR